MIVFALGIPHSGADWVAHVAAGILAAHEEPCQVVQAFESPKHIDDALAQHLSGVGAEGDSLVLRTSSATAAMCTLSFEPNCRSLMTYRDPRDVVATLIHQNGQENGIDFDRAVAMTAESFRLFREVFGLAHLTLLPYAHVVAAPEAMANQIALALNTLLDRGTIQRIVARATEVAGPPAPPPGAWQDLLDQDLQKAATEVFQDIIDLIGSD